MKADDIYADILRQLAEGVWGAGDRLPTERALAERYGVSRPTISRVLNRLRDAGQLKRVVGAGSFLTDPAAVGEEAASARRTLGLFVPGLGKGEIFEPICARIAEISHQYDVTLIWGSLPGNETPDYEERLRQAAQRFIDSGVQGVFFQPLERERGAAQRNRALAAMFEQAAIPLLLLDGDYQPYPQRSAHDLVGIDNVAAAYALCEHFMVQGATRVDFVWQANTASTLLQRLIGYREALFRHAIAPRREFEHEGDPSDPGFVQRLLDGGASNVICANDETAALLMRCLEALGVDVPGRVRIAGFDDVKYASLARVPLTTMRQPCRELGDIALKTMLERIANPWLAPRTVATPATLCVRASSLISTRN